MAPCRLRAQRLFLPTLLVALFALMAAACGGGTTDPQVSDMDGGGSSDAASAAADGTVPGPGAAACTPGEERCLGRTEFVCGPSADWQVVAQCPDDQLCDGEGGCIADPNAGACGDDVLNSGETCETSLMPAGLACSSLDPRFASGVAGCVGCQFSLDDCVLSGECGNGVLDPGEGCDDGNVSSDDGCSANCFSETQQTTGDTAADECGLGSVDLFGNPTGEADTFCDDPANRDTYTTGEGLEVRLTVHVVTTAAGNLAVAPVDLNAHVQEAQSRFAPAGIDLIWGGWGSVDFIIDTQNRFYDLTATDFVSLTQTNNDPDAVDVYVVNTYASSCGRATDIGSLGRNLDGAVYKPTESCAGATLAHELGHLFGLWHPHQIHEPASVAGDCDRTGDRCCDTPHDPGPTHANGGTGGCDNPPAPQCPSAVCADGSTPDIFNAMSYYDCADPIGAGSFSQDQIGRARCYIDRNYDYAMPEPPCDTGPSSGGVSISGGTTVTGPFGFSGNVNDPDRVSVVTASIQGHPGCDSSFSSGNGLPSEDVGFSLILGSGSCTPSFGSLTFQLSVRDLCGVTTVVDSFTIDYIDPNAQPTVQQCEPGSGPCCSASGAWLPASAVCDAEYSVDYRCSGPCGDPQVRYTTRNCSSSAAACSGSTSTGVWSTIGPCSASQYCLENDVGASCIGCPSGQTCAAGACAEPAPSAWSCADSHYGTGDGCHCGCGAPDLDCDSNHVSACDDCDAAGSCAATCPGALQPSANFLCCDPLDAPEVIAPDDGDTGESTSPELDWYVVDGAEQYRVFVATSYSTLSNLSDTTQSCGSCLVNKLVTNSKYDAPAGLLAEGTTYYWMVRAGSSCSGSPNSDVWSFTTAGGDICDSLDPPEVIDPDDGATNESLTPELDWYVVSGANQYRVFVSTSASTLNNLSDTTQSCGNCLVNEIAPNSKYDVPTGVLSAGTTYYWMVRAGSDCAGSPNSPVWSFTTEGGDTCDSLEQPSIIDPNDGATNESLTPELDWYVVSGADQYRVFVSTSASTLNNLSDTAQSCGSCVVNEVVTNSKYDIPSGTLSAGVKYYWMVRAGSDCAGSPNSPVWSFTTEPPCDSLSKPGLQSPSNNAQDQPATPLLNWASVSGAEQYRVFMATSSSTLSNLSDTTQSCGGCLVNEVVTSSKYDVPSGTLTADKTYYWMVRAGSDCSGSPNSSIWSFKTEEACDVLSTPSLTSPSNGATGQSTTLELDWGGVSGAQQCRVFVASASSVLSALSSTDTFCPGCVINEVTSSSHYDVPSGELAQGAKYYWMVRAGSDCAGSPNSSIRNFTTAGAAPEYDADPQCSSYSSSATFTCTGGVVFSICGTVNSSGNLTVKAHKSSGTFGSGSYNVRVFDPTVSTSDRCKEWNVVKKSNPSGIGTDTLTFGSFDSLINPGEAKAYCVTKTDGGDGAFWCSGQLDLTYE